VGGIIVGHEVARSLNARCVFAEREGEHMTLRRGFEIRRDENVLVVEDVVTTGGSVREVIDLVRAADANVIGVGYLVDRSGGQVDFGFPKATLLQMDVVKYDPGSCPLCRDGKLPAVKPGSRNLSLNIP
jgi:orotate phosphoribosyltransferase